MKALHLQLLVLHVAMAGILLLPLGAIIQPGLAADGSSIGTGVYCTYSESITDSSARVVLSRKLSKPANPQAEGE